MLCYYFTVNPGRYCSIIEPELLLLETVLVTEQMIPVLVVNIGVGEGYVSTRQRWRQFVLSSK